MKKTLYCSICIALYFAMLQTIKIAGPRHGHELLISNLIGDINLFVAFSVLGFMMVQYSKAVKLNENRLEQMINIDQLTGISNRRRIYQIIDREILLYNGTKTPFVIGMADIDDFKRINDTYGHLIGDQILKQVVSRMQTQLRKDDFLGRWGGEEFLIVLPRTSLQNGLQVFERVKNSFENTPLECGEYKIPITITIGIAEYSIPQTSDELVHQADEFLYIGKKNGKNKIVSDSYNTTG